MLGETSGCWFLMEVMRLAGGVVDAGEDVGVAFGVGGPEDDDFG